MAKCDSLCSLSQGPGHLEARYSEMVPRSGAGAVGNQVCPPRGCRHPCLLPGNSPNPFVHQTWWGRCHTCYGKSCFTLLTQTFKEMEAKVMDRVRVSVGLGIFMQIWGSPHSSLLSGISPSIAQYSGCPVPLLTLQGSGLSPSCPTYPGSVQVGMVYIYIFYRAGSQRPNVQKNNHFQQKAVA